MGRMLSTRSGRAAMVRRLLAVTGTAALLVAGSVASWWLIGDQSSSVPPRTKLDHLVRPPEIPPAVERIAGVGGCVAVLAGVVSVQWAIFRHGLARRWNLALAGVLGCAAFLGFAGRTVTAGVIGANIGAGLVMFVLAPIALLVALATIYLEWKLLRRAERAS